MNRKLDLAYSWRKPPALASDLYLLRAAGELGITYAAACSRMLAGDKQIRIARASMMARECEANPARFALHARGRL